MDLKLQAGELQTTYIADEWRSSNQAWRALAEEAMAGHASKGHAWLKIKNHIGATFTSTEIGVTTCPWTSLQVHQGAWGKVWQEGNLDVRQTEGFDWGLQGSMWTIPTQAFPPTQIRAASANFQKIPLQRMDGIPGSTRISARTVYRRWALSWPSIKGVATGGMRGSRTCWRDACRKKELMTTGRFCSSGQVSDSGATSLVPATRMAG